MDKPTERKIHFAPLKRQERTIRRLLRGGRYRNVTHFMRCAIDEYIDRIERPSLSEQARLMAEEHRDRITDSGADASALQDPSRNSNEAW